MLVPFPNMTFKVVTASVCTVNRLAKKKEELTGFPKSLFELVDFTVTKVTPFEPVFLLENKPIHSMLNFFRVSYTIRERKL